MVKQKCECQVEGVLRSEIATEYDEERGLPFVNHKPGKCKCTNELKQYHKKVWLCSNCVMGETPI